MFDGWLDRLTQWLRDLAEAVIGAMWEMLQDFLIIGLDMLLTALNYVLQYLPVPDFMTAHTICGMLSAGGPLVLWAATTFQIGPGLAMIGAGYAFRLIRKFATAFQW